MTQEELIKYLKGNAGSDDFTGGVDDSAVKSIELALKVNLPKSYKWFLQNYGMGGIWGIEILGYGKSTPPSVVTQTERYRILGLPAAYVVIENCDEFVYCLATDKMIDDECPVISWDRIAGYGGVRGNTFVEFLVGRLTDAQSDWEE
ncbi:SMI1/KNR4 family protein [bacterium BFN5]|nr:SMI1/KNR4 family protein [bacterium BFN5]QJW46924.1 SMI1/KNR4 family protein [bacterium BFN5]